MIPQHYPLYARVGQEDYAVVGWDRATRSPFLALLNNISPIGLMLFDRRLADGIQYMNSLPGTDSTES